MKKITSLLLEALAVLQAGAQKLPQVQQVSLRAPANVKVDGKATEWAQMKAYNKATDLRYTIANDDKKLYLVVQSDNQNSMAMLIKGITLVVQPTGEKNDKRAPMIKFPYLENPNVLTWFPLAPSAPEGSTGPVKDPDEKKAEAVIKESNKGLRELVKWIYIKDVLGKDSIISIYNDTGVEASNGFSNSKIYTSELAVHLNFLGLSIDRPTKFAYHILVNAEPNKYKSIMTDSYVRQRYKPSPSQSQAEVDAIIAKRVQSGAIGAITTDFWGEYTLAK